MCSKTFEENIKSALSFNCDKLSKTEKFLVIEGEARFRFRHMLTNETYELVTSGDKSTIVETVPGWTHDITNIGKNKLVVMLWANEIFDREHPDTFPSSL